MAAVLKQRYGVDSTLTLRGLKVAAAIRAEIGDLDAEMNSFETRERLMNAISVVGAILFFYLFPTLLKRFGFI